MNRYEKWKEKYGLEYLRRYAEEGLCDPEIAERVELKATTLKKWRAKYPEVSNAIRLGRADADFAVVEALYKKATGYTVNLSKTVKLKRSDFDPDTGKKIREYEELATAVDQSHVPADIRAGSFWLKCRQPERWSERQSNHDIGDFSGVVELPEADSIGEDEDDE